MRSVSSICDVPTSRVDAEALCLGDLAFGDARSGSRRASASLACPSPLPSPLAIGLPTASRLALVPGPLSVFLSRLTCRLLVPPGHQLLAGLQQGELPKCFQDADRATKLQW